MNQYLKMQHLPLMSYFCDGAKPRTIFSWNEGKISAMGEILHDNQRIAFMNAIPGREE